MKQQAERHYTVEDYFSVEETSAVKHEYFGGEIFAMAGASLAHNRITRDVLTTLQAKLRNSDCEVFGSDLRLLTPGGLYTYPDVMVICGVVELSTDRLETVINPTVIIEVLSDSTKDYDRGEKFTLYKALPSLREYLLVEQTQTLVEHFVKTDHKEAKRKAWSHRTYERLNESLELMSLGIGLKLAEIYAHMNTLNHVHE